jgi:RHS repeat-associated protein
MTNSSGAVFRQVRYTAYGDIRGRFDATSGTLPATESKRQEFTNYETEPETGLQFAHARFYDPTLSLFLSHDPAAQFASPYQYTAFDPVNQSDPSGALAEWAILFIFSVAMAGLQAIAIGWQTGDWGAAFKGFAISVAVSAASVGIFKGLVAVGLTEVQAGLTMAVASTAYQAATGPDAPALIGNALAIVGGVVGAVQEARAAAAASGLEVAHDEPGDKIDWQGYEVHTNTPPPPEYAPTPETQEEMKKVATAAQKLTNSDKAERAFVLRSRNGQPDHVEWRKGPEPPYPSDDPNHRGVPHVEFPRARSGDLFYGHSQPGSSAFSGADISVAVGRIGPVVDHGVVIGPDFRMTGITVHHGTRRAWVYDLP